jgi:hypothetical protein
VSNFGFVTCGFAQWPCANMFVIDFDKAFGSKLIKFVIEAEKIKKPSFAF